MQKVRVAGFSVSLDGFSAGIEQSLSDPLGKRGPELFQWFFRTKTFCAMHGHKGGVVDTDDEFARKAMDNFGAFILGRNMFGPVRGPWLDRSWKGWWGDNPPYHTPTFVLTHHEREPLVMEGGTTFHFVTGGFEEALVLEPEHEDALAGLGETLLKFGLEDAALRCFHRTLELGYADDLDLMLQIGRALFREASLR